MASFPYFSRIHSHARSVSLPSRPHPLAPEFDEILCRLRCSEASTSASIRSCFHGLRDLHECLHDLLLLPEAQKTLARECYERSINEILDGSLKLLAGCEAAKNALLVTKHSVQEFRSALRRRSGDYCLAEVASKYLACRRPARKSIHKVLKNLKGPETTNEEFAALSMIRGAERATAAVIESLLSFISGRKHQSWSLVSKLMQAKQIRLEDANELETIDAVMQSITRRKTVDKDYIQSHLGHLGSSIEDIQEGIERLHRLLIKTRVILLNIQSC